MKSVKVLVGIFILLLFINSNIEAAPAGNTSDPELPYGDGVVKLKKTIGSVKVSFDADTIFERELTNSGSVTDAELEGEWYLLKVSYPMFEERIEPYVKFGGSHLETSWKHNGGVVIVKGDNDLAWGIGAKFLAYELPKYNGLKFIIDGQYRSSEPDIDDVVVNDPARTVSASEFKINEWQIAGIVSMEFPLGSKSRFKKSDVYSLVPYVGIGYTDTDITSKFTFSNTNYSIGDGETDNKVVIITGCDLLSPDNVSVNVEGRLIGESSVSGGATVKF